MEPVFALPDGWTPCAELLATTDDERWGHFEAVNERARFHAQWLARGVSMAQLDAAAGARDAAVARAAEAVAEAGALTGQLAREHERAAAAEERTDIERRRNEHYTMEINGLRGTVSELRTAHQCAVDELKRQFAIERAEIRVDARAAAHEATHERVKSLEATLSKLEADIRSAYTREATLTERLRQKLIIFFGLRQSTL
jgi:hypothetical protein